MTQSGSGIAHRRRMKEATDYIREFLGTPQVAVQIAYQLHPGAGPLAARRVGLITGSV